MPFLEDIFVDIQTEKFVKDITSLSSQVMIEKEYNKSQSKFTPGTVFGIEVEVAYENDELTVKDQVMYMYACCFSTFVTISWED